MNTIEDKARKHAVEAFRGFLSEEHSSAGKLRDAIETAYLAGAREALAGQWRKSDDTEGLQDGDRVIVAIQRIDNSIKYFYAAYYHNGKFWNDSDDEEISFFNLWMWLPEPPKDESE